MLLRSVVGQHPRFEFTNGAVRAIGAESRLAGLISETTRGPCRGLGHGDGALVMVTGQERGARW